MSSRLSLHAGRGYLPLKIAKLPRPGWRALVIRNSQSHRIVHPRRSGARQLSTFERYVYPQLGEIQVQDLKRSKITAMLDGIAKKGGAVMADRALAYLRSGLNWYAARTDDWVSPIVRGMARTKPKERAGTRVLADDEIRDVWTGLDGAGDDLPVCYARDVRTVLLTALRRTEASEGSWPEIETIRRDGFEGPVWTVPSTRMKNKHVASGGQERGMTM